MVLGLWRLTSSNSWMIAASGDLVVSDINTLRPIFCTCKPSSLLSTAPPK